MVNQYTASFPGKIVRPGKAFAGWAGNGKRAESFTAITQSRQGWTIFDKNTAVNFPGHPA